ncbi:MAG: sodium:alanine symporter family protein [Candidatus Omnitrophica bacterium]|nr:sodium:alanine symporter family protein [Candidatus Omnitrophota bacterium]MCB9722186.1 sodium:alanine symporter family protein [Candidatus Omnitrophota bacterium]
MAISELLSQLSGMVWGLPLMVVLVGTGLYLSIRLAGIQLRGFMHAISVLRGKYDDPRDPGEISHFRALSTALSATIGTGNIVGVAAAILTGGPGAVFWMWITACVGMATKFTSCTLAVHFRKIDDQGEAHGGPMHYIELGMGRSYRWLAVCFASFTALASFGIGNMFQISSMTSAVSQLIYGDGTTVALGLRWTVGIVAAGLVAAVILGGIKRIARVAAFLVPGMCIFYVLTGAVILIRNAELIGPGLGLIFYHAFHAPESVAGGLIGGVIRSGVARGLFSNEAGLGSAAMAHGAAQTREPVREGLVAMLGPFIDTIIVCSITALVIICTGAYETVTSKGQLTAAAFEMGIGGTGRLVAVGILLFAFSTLIAWSYYGDRAVDFLFGKKAVTPYRWIYVAFVLIGALRPLDDVINFCDAMNGLMAVPNLIALLVLSPVVAGLTKAYFGKSSAGA